jgi:hypothetical protein
MKKINSKNDSAPLLAAFEKCVIESDIFYYYYFLYTFYKKKGENCASESGALPLGGKKMCVNFNI